MTKWISPRRRSTPKQQEGSHPGWNPKKWMRRAFFARAQWRMPEKKTPVALSVDDDARKCFEAQDLIRIILEDRNIQPRHIRAPALPKKFSQQDSALPPDVRKRSALPSIGSMNLGLRPKTWAPPEIQFRTCRKAGGL